MKNKKTNQIDLLLFFWAKDFQPKEYNKMIITYASCILMVLHVLGSFFAMFRLKKGYIAVDIIKFFVMLISASTMAILIHFFNIGKGLLFLIAILAILCTRATRMLNGNWLELLLDDLDEDDYSFGNIAVYSVGLWNIFYNKGI